MLTRVRSDFPVPVCLPNTEQWDIPSRAGRPYRILLGWPDTPMPREGWDVVYLLDGNAWFGTLLDSLRMRARRPEVTGVRPAIAVGIGYPIDDVVDVARRRYDLTPPRSGGAADDCDTGGADAFLDFLTDELGPLIDARFGLANQRRVLFGHSFGGLFVLHTVLTRPSAFAAYAAASPSLWFDDRALLRTCAATPLALSVPLMIAVGALEERVAPASCRAECEPPDHAALDREAPHRAMIANARAVAGHLGHSTGADREVQFHIFEGENHASVVPVALGRALPFLLANTGAA